MKPRIILNGILNVILEVVLGIVILLSGGCDGRADNLAASPPSTAPSAPTQQISIDNFSFSPQTLTVSPGTRVTWTNHDDVPHTVTSSTKAKPLSSHNLDTDDKYSFVFTEQGTYDYYCAVHPHMNGRIVVK